MPSNKMQRSTQAAAPAWLTYWLPWLAFAVLAIAVLQAPGVITKINTHDLYVVFDGIWRIFSGQQVFADFHSPIGIAYFLPYIILRHFEPFSLLTMFHGNLLVAFWLLLLATWTLRKRLSPALFFWAAFGIVAVAISPRKADMGITRFAHLAPYNRWCEAATMLAVPLLLLTSYESVAGQRKKFLEVDVPAALTFGLLALFLFHIKISFFICVVGVACIGLIFKRVSWQTLLLSAALFSAASLVLELTLHLHKPYFADINMAVAATVEVYGKVHLENTLSGPSMVVGYLICAAALIALSCGNESARQAVRRQKNLLLLVGVCLALAAVTNFQNSPQAEVPMMGAVLLVVSESLRRQDLLLSSNAIRRNCSLGVLFASIALIPLADAGAVLVHAAQSRTHSVCALPELRGTTGERLLFNHYSLRAPPSTGCDQIKLSAQDIQALPDDNLTADGTWLEVVRLTNAFQLMQGQIAAGGRIQALDFANPYPSFTGNPSPRGALLWWDLGRNYSSSSKPSPASLMSGTDYVLQSRLDPKLSFERHGENAWTAYGDEVMKSFKPAGEVRLWRLWVRKSEPAKPVP